MNNKTLAAIAAVIILAGGVVLVSMNKSSDKSDSKSSSAKTSSSQASGSARGKDKRACDILTKEIAIKIMGSAQDSDDPSKSPTTSQDRAVTSCAYTEEQTAGKTLNDTRMVSIIVKAAQSKAGVEQTNDQFGKDKIPEAQDVSGYGDAAYWDPGNTYLVIHKNDNAYYVSNYTMGNYGKGTLEDAKKAADALIDRM
ncbi:MAG: hypothetical protein WAQ24_05395 [Candidatus Saccharimonadales bacterium]